MEQEDIRWKQRFSNYKKALGQLDELYQLAQLRPLTHIEMQAMVKAFEFNYELGWNVMKDYLQYQGNVLITGSRDAIREAFKAGIVTDGEGWMDMLGNRNKTAHTYNEDVAKDVVEHVVRRYYALFVAFRDSMDFLGAQPL